MQEIKIRIPKEVLTKFFSDFNYIGTIPYIIGPFTPKEIELLKSEPFESLVIPNSEFKILII